MIRVSYSQYKRWVECAYSWKLKYVDKLDSFDQSIHSIFGTSVHRLVQDWLKDILFGDKSLIYAKTVDLSGEFKRILVEETKPHLIQIGEDGNKRFLFSRQELEEFYDHGLEIISYIQQNSEKIFPTKDIELFSIEYELNEKITDNIVFVGYIDIITYNKKTGEYHLYDLKTSSRGWNKYAKRDKSKTDQLLLYKKFFSEKLSVPLDKITLSYVILKRMLGDTEYVNPRVSEFVPSHGTTSMKRVWVSFNNFLQSAFAPDGNYISEQEASPSKSTCRFCSFNKNDLCEYVYKPATKKELLDVWVSLQ